MAEKYIGIENEITSFMKGTHSDRIDFSDYFHEFCKEEDYLRTVKSIRTRTGNGYYTDGYELEILTPPIAINKGFATRLTDSLMIGRKRVARFSKDLIHTGYSMHWNIAYVGDARNFLKGIFVPFHLFGLTPLSMGLNIDIKDNGARYQLAGDSIPEDEQINALALILGAYAYAIENKGTCPITFNKAEIYTKLNYLTYGRSTNICVRINNEDRTETILTAQDYLEIFYRWIEPITNMLGTKKEVRNLEEFIFGKKQLEFDKKSYYKSIIQNSGFDSSYGTYYPIKLPDTVNRMVIQPDSKKRKLPLEGRLLGELVKSIPYFHEFKWNEVRFSYKHQPFDLEQIEEIYNAVQKINPSLPKFTGSLKSEISPKDIDEIIQQIIANNHENTSKNMPENSQ